MILPFYHSVGNGVFITEDAVYWVELSRSLKRTQVRRYAKVMIEQGGIEQALQILAKKLKPSAPCIATHLDAAYVQHFILDVPTIEEEGLRQYLSAQIAKQLPIAAREQEFMIRYSVLQSAEDRLCCLVACARREAVEERIQLFEAAGLPPVAVGTLVGELGHAFSFEPMFVEGRAALLHVDRTECMLLIYENGRLVDCKDVWAEDSSTLAAEAALHVMALEAAAPGRAALGPLQVTGPGAPALLAAMPEPAPWPMEEGVPLLPLARMGKNRLPVAYAAAAGLAVRQLYPTLSAINLMDEATIARHRQAAEKKEAYRMILAVGGSLFVLFALIAGMHVYASKQLEQVSIAMVQASMQMAAVDRAQNELRQVRAEQNSARALVEAQTHTATLMEAIGRAVPENVWLDRLQLLGEASRSKVTIQGSAYDEQETARFLATLEALDRLRNVRLMYSEVATTRISTRPALRGLSLSHRFEIQAEVVR